MGRKEAVHHIIVATPGDAVMAQAAQQLSKPNDTSATVQAVTNLLAEPRSPSRDQQLHAAAVALFKAIEAGEAPIESRDTFVRALHEVALGGSADAWVDYGRCLWNGWGGPRDREAASAALVGFDLHFHTLAKATLTGLYGR